MLHLFRTLVLLLATIAPGETGCNQQFTVCWVSFQNPDFVEYIYPDNPARVRALLEIKAAE